jgi:hypothetical protein
MVRGSHTAPRARLTAINLRAAMPGRMKRLAGIDAWTHADQQFEAHLEKVPAHR